MYKYSCWSLWIPVSLVCASNGVLQKITSASSSFFFIFSLFLSTCWRGDLRQAFFFFSLVFCYYSYVGFRNVSAFNLKHWFFVLVSWGFGVKTYDSCFWICMFVFLFFIFYLYFVFCIYLILNLNLNKPRSLNWLLNQKVWNWINIVFLLEMFQNL